MSDSERLLAELRVRAEARPKLGIDSVWDAFRSVVRGYTGSAEARARLAELLGELATQNAVVLPRGRRLWRTDAAPPLPHWVRIPLAETPVRERVDHRAIAWPPELAFVSQLERARAVDELIAIRRFLAQGGRDAVPVPVRERSLEIFGDEKRLDTLRQSELFRSGRLSLQLLRCFDVAPPLVWEAVDTTTTTRTVLILENLHTYESFRRWNARVACYAAIAYGHGHEFKATVRDVPRVCEAVAAERVEYFGDIDARGLEIAAYAGTVLGQERTDFRLAPAERWYEALMVFADRARPATPAGAESIRAVAWLPASIQSAVRDLLLRGARIPQEWIGTRVLSTLTS